MGAPPAVVFSFKKRGWRCKKHHSSMEDVLLQSYKCVFFFCWGRAAQKGFYCINCFTFQWTVQLDPKFHEGASNLEQLVPFEECLQLYSTDTSVVQIPEYILVTNNGRSFKLVSFVYSITAILFSFVYSVPLT